jgi:hypothetical protein
MSELAPRLLNDKQAAVYIGFSQSFLRNQRYADAKRVEENLPALAPAHLQVGRRIRYTVPALDAWVDGVTAGTHPMCLEEKQPDAAA